MKIFTTLVASSLAFCQLAHAWDYSSTDAAAVATPADAHETFTKTWTVSGDNVLSELTVNSFGRVFIDYDASLASGDGARTVAKIVFSGNSTTLLDAFEVVDADDNTNGIKIRVKNEDLEDHAYFLTQIYVSGKQAITSIGQVWSGDLVIGDDVVVQNNASATLDLALAGSGDVYAGSPSTEFSLNALNVAVAGSGDIQVLAKCLDVNSSLSVNIAGSGDVGVVADTIKSVNDISAAVAGSGDVFVQAGSLTTYNLTSVIGGSGSITYSKDGTAQEQSVAIAGSGDVASASIKAVNTEVSIVGSGDVLVQTTGNLNVSTVFSSGDIRYYGAKPSAINVESSLVFGSHKKKHVVKEAKKNHFEEYEVQSLPARKAIFVAVKLDKSFFSSQPNVKYLIEVDSESDWLWNNALINNNLQFNAMQSFSHPHSFAIFAIVGVAFAAVGVAVRKYQRRQERARYAPLV